MTAPTDPYPPAEDAARVRDASAFDQQREYLAKSLAGLGEHLDLLEQRIRGSLRGGSRPRTDMAFPAETVVAGNIAEPAAERSSDLVEWTRSMSVRVDDAVRRVMDLYDRCEL